MKVIKKLQDKLKELGVKLSSLPMDNTLKEFLSIFSIIGYLIIAITAVVSLKVLEIIWSYSKLATKKLKGCVMGILNKRNKK